VAPLFLSRCEHRPDVLEHELKLAEKNGFRVNPQFKQDLKDRRKMPWRPADNATWIALAAATLAAFIVVFGSGVQF
jgi:hypothetical protein